MPMSRLPRNVGVVRPKLEGPGEIALFVLIIAVAIGGAIYMGAMMVALLRIVWKLGNA